MEIVEGDWDPTKCAVCLESLPQRHNMLMDATQTKVTPVCDTCVSDPVCDDIPEDRIMQITNPDMN